MNEARLYQFPLSHYCEKARWALDYKGVPYSLVNLIPALHLLTTRRLSGTNTVPVLKNGSDIITDSTEIINYLDKIIPQNPLTPKGDLGHEAIEMEEYCDQEIGVHIRRVIYYYVLPKSGLSCRLLFHASPLWLRPSLYLFFPFLKIMMTQGMRIDESHAAKSLKRLENALDKLNKILEKNDYLVGKNFTRADLTAAALIAPLVQPSQHTFPWPEQSELPKPLRDLIEAWRSTKIFHHVEAMYKKHRLPH